MKLRPLFIVGGAIVLAMLAVSAWAWPQIPADAQIPVHWGPSGEADGFGPKWLGLLGLPLVGAGILALFALLPRIEPRRQNLERSATAYVGTGIAAVAFMGVLHVVAVMAALGDEANVVRVVELGTGVLFVVIGNYLGKTRSNWFFGIRTPWTLSSERSWNRTHRLGGYLFVGLGVAIMLAALLLAPETFVWLLLIGIFGSIAVLFGYSYLAWRGDPDREVTS
jgi:uncharacterized membrane protein